MLRDIFRTLDGTDSFGLISMLIFLIFFIMVIWYALSLKPKDMDKYSNMPLDESARESNTFHDI